MFQRMLVPLDGSRLAEAVLPCVQKLADLVSCSVTLLHVIEKKAPTSIHGDVHLREVEEAEIYLTSISRKLAEGRLRVETHVHSVPQGDIPRCIAEHARELDQDLIVLCSHGSGGMRRFVFGSNAEQVLTHGVTPVLLIQPDEECHAPPFGPERILIVLDNSPATEPALTMGAQLASASRARIDLLAVVPTMASMSAEQAASGRLIPGATRHILDLSAEEAAAYLQKEVNDLLACDVRAGGRVERGETASTVVRVADEIRSDLLVIAARGVAGLSAFWADAIVRKVASVYCGALLLVPVGGS